MSDMLYLIGEFPGHEQLVEILDSEPMPDKPGLSGAALKQNPLDKFQSTVERLLEERGYPTSSMELDALIDRDLDNGVSADLASLRRNRSCT